MPAMELPHSTIYTQLHMYAWVRVLVRLAQMLQQFILSFYRQWLTCMYVCASMSLCMHYNGQVIKHGGGQSMFTSLCVRVRVRARV